MVPNEPVLDVWPRTNWCQRYGTKIESERWSDRQDWCDRKVVPVRFDTDKEDELYE